MKYKIREKLFGANKSNATGTSMTLNDTVKYPIKKLTIDGVCKQETTTGKNLLDYVSNIISSANGFTNTLNEDGSITTSGKPKANYSSVTKTTDITDILEDEQTYTISRGNASNKVYVQIVAKKVDGTYTYINSISGSNSFKVNKTLYTNYSIMIQTNTINNWGDSSLTITNKYMLCKGTDTADTSFEPYTGGQPSPSPDYPQEISVLTGDIKVTSCVKNLFNVIDYTKISIGSAGLSTVTKATNKITVKPNATRNSSGMYILLSNILKYVDNIDVSKQYTISMDINISNSALLKYGWEALPTSKTFGKGLYRISSKNTPTSSFILYGMQADTDIEVTNIMISLDDDTYEPYQDSSLNITIPENEFVGKIGDVKDTLNVVYKNDGHYHLILNKMIGKVVLDGVTNYVTSINLRNGNHTVCNYVNSDIKILESETIIIANKLIGTTLSKTWNGNILYSIGQSTNGHYLQLCLPSTFTTSEQINNWLKDNPTIIYYILETPYEIDLGIVDQLLTFDEITNIFTDSNLYPVINVDYYSGSLDISNYEYFIKEV